MAYGIQFRAAAYNTSTGTTSLAVNKPTGTVDGDLMITSILLESNTDVLNSYPSNWNLIKKGKVGTRNLYLYTYFKVASSEGSSYTWGSSSSVEWVIINSTFYQTAPNEQSPVYVAGATISTDTGSSQSVTAPAVTVQVANNMVIHVGGSAYGTTFTPPGGSSPTWSEAEDRQSGSGSNNIAMSMSYATYTATGSTGDISSTSAASDYRVAIMFEIKQATITTLTRTAAWKVITSPTPISRTAAWKVIPTITTLTRTAAWKVIPTITSLTRTAAWAVTATITSLTRTAAWKVLTSPTPLSLGGAWKVLTSPTPISMGAAWKVKPTITTLTRDAGWKVQATITSLTRAAAWEVDTGEIDYLNLHPGWVFHESAENATTGDYTDSAPSGMDESGWDVDNAGGAGHLTILTDSGNKIMRLHNPSGSGELNFGNTSTGGTSTYNMYSMKIRMADPHGGIFLIDIYNTAGSYVRSARIEFYSASEAYLNGNQIDPPITLGTWFTLVVKLDYSARTIRVWIDNTAYGPYAWSSGSTSPDQDSIVFYHNVNANAQVDVDDIEIYREYAAGWKVKTTIATLAHTAAWKVKTSDTIPVWFEDFNGASSPWNFDEIRRTTDKTDMSGNWSRSSDFGTGYEAKSTTANRITVFVEQFTRIPTVQWVRFYYKAETDLNIGVHAGANWSGDDDYEGGVVGMFRNSDRRRYVGYFSVNGTVSAYDYSTAATLTNETWYRLKFTITDNGNGTCNLGVGLYNLNYTQIGTTLTYNNVSSTAFSTKAGVYAYIETTGTGYLDDYRAEFGGMVAGWKVKSTIATLAHTAAWKVKTTQSTDPAISYEETHASLTTANTYEDYDMVPGNDTQQEIVSDNGVSSQSYVKTTTGQTYSRMIDSPLNYCVQRIWRPGGFCRQYETLASITADTQFLEGLVSGSDMLPVRASNGAANVRYLYRSSSGGRPYLYSSGYGIIYVYNDECFTTNRVRNTIYLRGNLGASAGGSDQYNFRHRRYGTGIFNLQMWQTGGQWYISPAGGQNSAISYTPGNDFEIKVVLDYDNHTFDVYFDDTLEWNDYAMDSSTVEFGSDWCVYASAGGSGHELYIESIEATGTNDSYITIPDDNIFYLKFKTGSSYVSAAHRLDTNGSYSGLWERMDVSGSGGGYVINVVSDGSYHYKTGVITSDTEYTLKFVIDWEAKTYDMYINGVLYNGTGEYADIPFDNDGSNYIKEILAWGTHLFSLYAITESSNNHIDLYNWRWEKGSGGGKTAAWKVRSTITSLTRAAAWKVIPTITSLTRSAAWMVQSTITSLTKTAAWGVAGESGTFYIYRDAAWKVQTTITSLTRTAAWKVLTPHTIERTAAWKVIPTITTLTHTAAWKVIPTITSLTRSAAWAVHATITSLTRSAGWAVHTTITSLTRASAWKVKTTITSLTRSAAWDVTSGTQSFYLTAAWKVKASLTIDRTAAWKVLTAHTIPLTAAWLVRTPHTIPLTAAWMVRYSGQVQRTAAWAVPSSGQVQRAAAWKVKSTQTGLTRTAAWGVLPSLYFQLTAAWKVISTRTSLTHSAAWKILTPHTIQRTAAWSTGWHLSIERLATWRVRTTQTLTPSTAWKVLAPRTVQRTAAWAVTAGHSIQLTAGWAIPGEAYYIYQTAAWAVHVTITSLTRAAAWKVITAGLTIPLAASWKVLRTFTNYTRTAAWDVKTTITSLTRTAAWSVGGYQHIDRTAAWAVPSSHTLQLQAAWGVVGELPSEFLYVWKRTA